MTLSFDIDEIDPEDIDNIDIIIELINEVKLLQKRNKLMLTLLYDTLPCDIDDLFDEDE